MSLLFLAELRSNNTRVLIKQVDEYHFWKDDAQTLQESDRGSLIVKLQSSLDFKAESDPDEIVQWTTHYPNSCLVVGTYRFSPATAPSLSQ